MGEEQWKNAGGGRVAPQDLGLGVLFDQIHEAVVVTDLDGRIVLWNTAAEEIFQYTREQVIGKPVNVLVPERLMARHELGMERFRRTGHGRYVDERRVMELPALRADGREIVVEMTLSRFGRRGDFLVAILRDVTRRVELLALLDTERNRLRVANDALESFAYVVSHDLKEPVRAMQARLEAAEEEFPDSSALDHLRRASEANDRLGRLLSGLLEWSRVSQGEVVFEPVDVKEALESAPCRAQYEGLLEGRGGTLRVAEGMPRVLATTGILCQILGNLVVNALRHNPSPEPEVLVRAARAPDGLVDLVVEDNGPGFRDDLLARAAARGGGHLRGGFGLLITRRAVARLGGRMQLENRPEGGARVTLSLPAA